ncbi:MAG: haloacid dehalogenase-like hydrolase, partial [Gemmatimonadales bacterium]
ELMIAAGLEAGEVRRRMPEVWPVYLRLLERELEARKREGRIRLLPGIIELLAALDDRSDVTIGLLTGNIEEGARLKLAAAGLGSTFGVGGFGSDSEDRAEVARAALNRCRDWGGEASATVVLGDTPEDVACARAVDAFAVAVATGRHKVDELLESGADAVFEDFSETEAVLSCILSLAGMDGAPADTVVKGGGR